MKIPVAAEREGEGHQIMCLYVKHIYIYWVIPESSNLHIYCVHSASSLIKLAMQLKSNSCCDDTLSFDTLSHFQWKKLKQLSSAKSLPLTN